MYLYVEFDQLPHVIQIDIRLYTFCCCMNIMMIFIFVIAMVRSCALANIIFFDGLNIQWMMFESI